MYSTHHLLQFLFCIFCYGGSSCEIPFEESSLCALFASRASQFFRFLFLFWFSRMELPFPEILSCCFPDFLESYFRNVSWMASFSSLKYREKNLFCLRVILRWCTGSFFSGSLELPFVSASSLCLYAITNYLQFQVAILYKLANLFWCNP